MIVTAMEELTYEESIRRASKSLCRFPLRSVRGIPLMEPIAQNWESVWSFCPDPSDLLISTYPKAGETEKSGWGRFMQLWFI